MNLITFKTIKMKNFMSVRNEISFDYRNLTGLTYVYGENKDNPGATNGAGKSATMLYALLVALFGKTINNINNAYLFNRSAPYKEHGYIELEFTKNSSEDYRIFVELVPNKAKTFCALNFSLFKNEKDITKASKLDTLKYIESEIIGCSFEVFKNTVVMSSSNILNFFEMPKRVKNEYLQGIFSLTTMTEAYTIALQKANSVKKELRSTSDQLVQITENIASIEEQDKHWAESNNKQMKELSASIKKKIQDKESLESKEDVLTEIKDYDKKIEFLNRQDELTGIKCKIDKSLRSIRNQLVEEQSKIKANEIILKKHKKLFEVICQDCLPKVKALYKVGDSIELDKSLTLIDELKEKEAKLEANLKKVSNLLSKVSKIQIEINEAKNRTESKQREIQHLDSEIKTLEKRLEALMSESSPFNKIIEDFLQKKAGVEASISKLQKASKYYGIVKDVFSDTGAKQIIVCKIIEALNSSIHSYLRQMGADFLVYFDNKLVYEFETPSGTCEYGSFSAGERRKLDLAILFAFRDVLGCSSLRTNLCIIDEILDSAIDTSTLNSVINILKNKSTFDNQAIVVISHREGLIDNEMFSHKVKIIKENNSSSFIQEL